MMEMQGTPEAIQDRETIYDYIEADNPIALPWPSMSCLKRRLAA